MRDAIEGGQTGSIGTMTLATSGTTVYWANYIDLGTISSSSRFTLHTLFNGLYAVFSNEAAAFGAADSMNPGVQDDSATNFTTTVKTTQFQAPAVAQGTGSYFRYRMPENGQRYWRHYAVPTTTSSWTSGSLVMTCWFEEGARMGPKL